jgi:hypothetical protein
LDLLVTRNLSRRICEVINMTRSRVKRVQEKPKKEKKANEKTK